MNDYVFIVKDESEGERIDKCLNTYLDMFSRSFLQKLIKDEKVFVNGESVKSNYKVKTDDTIALTIPESVELNVEAENIPLDILYEDDAIVIVNKPKGMVVHPAAGHYSGTLVNALLYHCKSSLSGINGIMRPGIVHRLDKDTTGSLVVCKNDTAHLQIAEQLANHTFTRIYIAIVYGVMKEDEGVINKPIGRHPKDRKKMAINPKGRIAVTHFKVIERFKNYTLVECRLETGRTHQIRVHMSSIGYPILGDEVYSSRKVPFSLQGQTLHAMTIGFIHPNSKDYKEFNAPLPEYFEELISKLRNMS